MSRHHCRFCRRLKSAGNANQMSSRINQTHLLYSSLIRPSSLAAAFFFNAAALIFALSAASLAFVGRAKRMDSYLAAIARVELNEELDCCIRCACLCQIALQVVMTQESRLSCSPAKKQGDRREAEESDIHFKLLCASDSLLTPRPSQLSVYLLFMKRAMFL